MTAIDLAHSGTLEERNGVILFIVQWNNFLSIHFLQSATLNGCCLFVYLLDALDPLIFTIKFCAGYDCYLLSDGEAKDRRVK